MTNRATLSFAALAAALAFSTPALAAPPARPIATAAVGSDITPAPSPAVDADAARYANREASAGEQTHFRGGDGYVVIGGTTLAVVLLVVLLIVLL